MPSNYPGAPDTFTTKQDQPGTVLGQPYEIYAEDIDAIQDAVVAVQQNAVDRVNDQTVNGNITFSKTVKAPSTTAAFREQCLLYDDFQRANGSLGTAKSGQVWTVSGSQLPTIVSNRYVATGTPGAGYAMLDAGQVPYQIGSTFCWTSGSTTTGSLAMICSIDPGIGLNNMVHFIQNSLTWSLQKRIAGGSFTTVISGTFSTPLTADGATVYEARMTIVGSTVYLLLPDGTRASATDSDFATLPGPRCIWEPITSVTTDQQAQFRSVWAVNSNGLVPRSPFPKEESLAKFLQTVGERAMTGPLEITAVPPIDVTKASLRVGSGSMNGIGPGTQIAAAAASGFAGNLLDLQTNATSMAKVDASGNLSLNGAILAVTSVTHGAGTFRGNNSGNAYLDAVGAAGSVTFRTNAGASTVGVFDSSGNFTATGSVKMGGGTPLTKAVVYSQTITPAAVAANTTAEQTFTVTGLATTDKVIVNGPAPTAGTGIVNMRASATNTLALTFSNSTAGSLTPASGTYNILAFRS